MTSIKELNLSPLTHTVLAYNGIKTIEGLSRYTEEELKNLKIMDYYFDPNKTMSEIVEDIVKEIKTTLSVINEMKKALSSNGVSIESTEEVLDTEKRIKELDLPRVTVDRLRRNKIVTLGTLSTLDERDFSRMYRIGNKTLNDIKSILPLEDGKIKKLSIDTMIFKDLSEEEITVVREQINSLNEIVENNRKIKADEDKEQKENKRRKDILMSMKISDLYIPEPVLMFKIISLNPIENMNLGQLVHWSLRKQDFINKLELENAISRLNIKGLHLELTPKEYNDLEVSELDLKRIEEYKLERRIEALKLIERVYKEKLKNNELKEEIRKNKNLVEYLESLEQENARLTAINNKYKSIIDEYGIDPSESGQGQHRK